MPRKKRARSQKSSKYQELPLLAVSVGVIFFILQLLFLLFVYNPAGPLLGIITALWVGGGIVFATGVVGAIRESRWSLLLLSAPAFAFGAFCVLSFLSGFGQLVAQWLTTVNL
ncbi:MAG: hypothetical protein WEA04_01535 [Candidatus Andersenbacteria bacterium]